MIGNDQTCCNQWQPTNNVTRRATSMPHRFTEEMYASCQVSSDGTKTNLNPGCGLLHPQKVVKTKALKSFVTPDKEKSEFDFSYDKTDALQIDENPRDDYCESELCNRVSSLPENIYKKDNTTNGSPTSMESSRKASRSLSELRAVNRKDSRRARKMSKLKYGGSLERALSQEKMRLQTEREVLEEVQNELRSKLPKTFQVTATLGLNPQLLGRRNTEGYLDKPQPRTRGPSMPAIFKWYPSDDSDDESSLLYKIKGKIKKGKETKEGIKMILHSLETKMNKSLPTITGSKNNTKSLGKRASLDHTMENKPVSRTLATNENRRPYSESERDSTSSGDSGIVLRDTAITKAGAPETKPDITSDEQWLPDSPAIHIEKYETVDENGESLDKNVDEPVDEERLKEIAEHLKEIDIAFDITE